MMMKKSIQIGTLVAVMALLTACGGGTGVFGSSGPDMGEASTTKVMAVSNEENAPRCEMTLKVKYVKGDNEAARNINNAIEQRLFMMEGLTMQQAADSFANAYTARYRNDMAPLYREDRGDEAKHAWYEYRYSVETSTQEGKDGCLVYMIDLDMFEGGAHGIRQKLVLNFDTQTGRQITLDDLLAPGWQYPLNDLLMDELRRVTKCGSLDELHANDYLLTMDIYAPQNFIVGEDGITFIYNPYEIAPYAKGNTELTLSYDTLRAIMK